MKCNWKRMLALMLAACLPFSGAALGVCAAAPAVTTDETAYVTLDYYGSIDHLSIVKACSLNGLTAFADYGKYQSVNNMTTLDEPVVFGDMVDWEITEEVPNRFYYEVVPEEQSITLPWSFDISYRLNGKPATGESLAGASGLIDIEVAVTANPRASSYLKNNFMLILGTMSSTEDNYSFSVPGAQLQSLGSYQVAFYPILPRGEETVTFSFGSDSFESPGIFMMMAPITLSQLDDIAEIQEHKANIEASGNAVDAIFDDLFSIMGGMKGGIGTTVEGLGELEQARQAIDSNRDTIKSDTKTLINALDRFRRVTWHLGDELDDSRMDQTIDRLGDSFGKMVDALGGMGAGVEELQDATVELYDLMNDLEKAHDREKQQKLVGKIGKKLQEINEIMEELEKIGVSGGIDSGTFEAFREARRAINSDQVPDEMAEEIVSELLATMEEQLSEMSGSIQGDLSTTMELLDGMQGMQSSIYQLSNDVSVILNETSDMIFGLTDLLKPMTQSLETFDKTLEESSDHLNDGARLTLKGMTQMLNDLSDALDKTDDLQAQKDIISGIIRDEWKRLDEDLSLLDIDTKAEKRSFTSAKNPPPSSLQIILRTQEIEIDEEEQFFQSPDEEENIGALGRIGKVFEKIGSTIGGIFS